MTILLYDYCDLEERPSRHTTCWKAWHLILYVLAAVFGILNYVFLQNTMDLVDNNCVLFPRELAFHYVELPEAQNILDFNGTREFKNVTDDAQPFGNVTMDKVKREAKDNETADANEVSTVEANVTISHENKTHRHVLDISRTLFREDSDCLFAEYMPLLSTVFALLWITLFTMCASGGHVRTGLTQPWRILAPALLFALVMVGLTGHNFTLTNGGLHAFCEAFFDVTNSTTCSAVNPFLELSWNTTWGMGGRAAATRAASAGVWATWACAAALLLARCLAAPDFVVKRTGVYLSKDPQDKIIPHLKRQQKSLRSPEQGDNVSIKSEPTVTTELVTASVDQGDSAPTSLMVTPVRTAFQRNTEEIEMAYTPQERFENH
ncbi:uncharacterized protein LOC142981111 [Anticarsia gemmatalis]|uniref:uncharacterized protein LOC142981111 n=1 Tax=Anticarsia gemmatalis TaxID=129554 RepID=UPI003F774F16